MGDWAALFRDWTTHLDDVENDAARPQREGDRPMITDKDVSRAYDAFLDASEVVAMDEVQAKTADDEYRGIRAALAADRAEVVRRLTSPEAVSAFIDSQPLDPKRPLEEGIRLGLLAAIAAAGLGE